MIALEVLQQSNPAHDLESFLRLEGQLKKAMNLVVESTFPIFYSLQSFAKYQ